MVDVKALAKYVKLRYESSHDSSLDEMKLHKMLYFIQRESFVIYDRPIFPNRFEAWKYGPVMRCIRGNLWALSSHNISDSDYQEYREAIDYAFKTYADKDSWTLSNISHGETCWRKAKNKETNGQPVEILTEDISIDAQAIKLRRILLSQ